MPLCASLTHAKVNCAGQSWPVQQTGGREEDKEEAREGFGVEKGRQNVS